MLAGRARSQREAIPNPGQPDHLQKHRVQLKLGNRDLYGVDFRWVDEADDRRSASEPRGRSTCVERREYGPLIGTPVAGRSRATRRSPSGPRRPRRALPGLVAKAARDRGAIRRIEKDEIGDVNYAIERLRLERREARLPSRSRTRRATSRRAPGARRARDGAEGRATPSSRRSSRKQMEAAARHARRVPHRRRPGEGAARRSTSYRAYPRERAVLARRAPRVYASRALEFLADEPRESNTEGGIFPAIFGTVMMVFLMSLAVVPFGVLAALYLREYAKQGLLVRTVRIAVNNLAGVPSIVFGVFGLGFFVYFVGGGDRPALLPGGAADADLRHRRHPVGVADARAAHRAGRDRRHRGGAGRGAALDARGARSRWARPSSRRSCASCCRRPRPAS